MLKNYFKTAFRNLTRNKKYTFLNVAGLSVGLAVCLIIFIVINYEKSFDGFHNKKDRIYRVISEFNDASGTYYSSGVPIPFTSAFRNDLPQVEKASGILSDQNTQIQILDDQARTVNKFKEESGVFFTEPEFFEIFDFEWLAGTAAVLNEPNQAVLSRSTAIKYFGDWKIAIGKTFKRNNRKILKVAGIIEDVPTNTDFQFKIIISYKTMNSYGSNDWGTVSSNAMCYFSIGEGQSLSKLSRYLPGFARKYMPEDKGRTTFLIQPLSEVHFDSRTGNFSRRTVSPELLKTLSWVALFILIIACVNFINLSTAQSVNRSKEVSIRKVLGSGNWPIRLQFLGETTIISFAALFLALLIVFLSLPSLNSILELNLSIWIIADPFIILGIFGLTVILILIAAFYPALVLSRFNPVTALKAKVIAQSSKGFSLRKSLVVIQFLIAQVLIIGTLIMIRQINYFRTKSLGFDKEAIMTVTVPADSIGRSKIDYLKSTLLQRNDIQSVSFGSGTPMNITNWYSEFEYDNSGKKTDFAANLKFADADYINTFGLKLIEGRNYIKSDTANEVVVNELLIRQLGLKQPKEIINKELNFWDGEITPVVVGVVKDFHAQSLQQPLTPVVIGNNKQQYVAANIKLKEGQIGSAVPDIEKIWNSTFPDFVFEYQFLNDAIDTFYRQEERVSYLYQIFAGIAIFLSCLGLYGLASFMAFQRIKEVGIRKVLGASVQNIVYLFSKEFVYLIIVAFIIATPIAWYFMNKWLQDFSFRLEIDWRVFVMAAFISLLIALITISSQAIKAALSNPVKNLNTE